jgi:hypothetical protein
MFNKNILLGIPALAGAGIGAVKGAVDGYTSSNKDHLIYNYYNTIGGAIVGTSGGLVLGLTWFISVPIFIVRKMNGIPFDGLNKDIRIN